MLQCLGGWAWGWGPSPVVTEVLSPISTHRRLFSLSVFLALPLPQCSPPALPSSRPCTPQGPFPWPFLVLQASTPPTSDMFPAAPATSQRLCSLLLLCFPVLNYLQASVLSPAPAQPQAPFYLPSTAPRPIYQPCLVLTSLPSCMALSWLSVQQVLPAPCLPLALPHRVVSVLSPISPHATSTSILSSPPLALRHHSKPLSNRCSDSSSLLLFSPSSSAPLCPVAVQLPDLLLPALCRLILQSGLASLTGSARGGQLPGCSPRNG